MASGGRFMTDHPAHPSPWLCPRCSEPLADFAPHLRSIARLQRAPREQHVGLLAKLEAVPEAVAAAWVRHR
jgi:hypothetical protein